MVLLVALACVVPGTPLAAAPRARARVARLVRVTGDELGRDVLAPRGRARLVHLWASWCVPCRAELPLLAEGLRAKHRRDLDVVVLALDEPSADREVRRLLTRAGPLPGKSWVVSPSLAAPHILRIDAEWDGSVPASYVLDRAGKLAFAQRGLSIVPELMAEVDRVLAAQ